MIDNNTNSLSIGHRKYDEFKRALYKYFVIQGEGVNGTIQNSQTATYDEKTLLTSDLGINPSNDGKIIRLVFPELTEERRKELAKDVKKMAEDAKIAVRNCRRDGIDAIKAMKKNNEITEDEQADGDKLVQKSTDKFVAEIDSMFADKEKEILAI